MHGDPPTLPEEGYSEEAHAFVHACLDKNPSKRPSYSTLLRHPWLAPLMQPPTESNGTEATSAAPSAGQPGGPDTSTATEDEEVAEWVKERIERRQRGTYKRQRNLHCMQWPWMQCPVALCLMIPPRSHHFLRLIPSGQLIFYNT